MLLFLLKELERRLSDCQSAVSTQNDDGSRLANLVGADGACRVKELMDRGNKMVNDLSDKVKLESERVKLQRHQSLEVCLFITDHSRLLQLQSFC